MATTYLIDTNVIIDYTANKFSGLAEKRLDAIFDDGFHYSVISRIEVLGYHKASIQTFQSLSAFLNFGKMYDVEIAVADKAVELRRTITKKSLPDLIIATTAMVHDLILLTNNVKDFVNVPDLKIENPWDW